MLFTGREVERVLARNQLEYVVVANQVERIAPAREAQQRPLIAQAAGVMEQVANRNLGMEVIFSDERTKLRETGGGLMHAKELIGDAPFFCINSDNYWIDGIR